MAEHGPLLLPVNLPVVGIQFTHKITTGHLRGCGGADPHNLLTSASPHNQSFFPHKTEKLCHITVAI